MEAGPCLEALHGLCSSLRGTAGLQAPPCCDQCASKIIAACVWLKLPARRALFWSHGKTLAPFVWHGLAEIGFCLTLLCKVKEPFSQQHSLHKKLLVQGNQGTPRSSAVKLNKLASISLNLQGSF